MNGNRIEKAHKIADLGLIGVLTRDKEMRIASANVPGSEGKRYEVIIRRNGGITTECQLDIGVGHEPCKGNRMTVCYHSIAVLILCAIEADRGVSFCKTEDHATRLARIDGKVVKVSPYRTPERPMYMVVTGNSPTEVTCPNCEKKTDADELTTLGFCYACTDEFYADDGTDTIREIRSSLYG